MRDSLRFLNFKKIQPDLVGFGEISWRFVLVSRLFVGESWD